MQMRWHVKMQQVITMDDDHDEDDDHDHDHGDEEHCDDLFMNQMMMYTE